MTAFNYEEYGKNYEATTGLGYSKINHIEKRLVDAIMEVLSSYGFTCDKPQLGEKWREYDLPIKLENSNNQTPFSNKFDKIMFWYEPHYSKFSIKFQREKSMAGPIYNFDPEEMNEEEFIRSKFEELGILTKDEMIIKDIIE